MVQLTEEGKAKLQQVLEELVADLPCAHLSVASADGVIFDGHAGSFDPLEPTGRKAGKEDVLWFASTTKLLTALCYLVLVDRGVLRLDTDMRQYSDQLKQATSKVITGFDENGPILLEIDQPVTLGQMLNQTSGFGMEFGETVPQWKKYTDKGKGFVNSCKIENLVHTPLCEKPGEVYQYGNSAEWLALILPNIVGQSTEDYLQENLVKPLGLTSTTYYPFDSPNLVPLRWGKGAEEGGKIEWEVLNGQLDLLTLPRKREEIEYPAGGGGVFSSTSDYIRVLQYLLQHYLSLSGKAQRPANPLLSDELVKSVFTPTLPDSAIAGFTEFYNGYLQLLDESSEAAGKGQFSLSPGDANWSTAVAIYSPKDGKQRSGWGRHAGSVGWGGAAGTEYWVDPDSGIAAVFTTQMLPGRCPAVHNGKLIVEKAIYQVLEKK